MDFAAVGKTLRIFWAIAGRGVALIASMYVILVLFANLHYFIDARGSGTFFAPTIFLGLVLLAALVALFHPHKVLSFARTPLAWFIAYMVVLHALNTWRVLNFVPDASPLSREEVVDVFQRSILFPAAAFVLYVQRLRVIESLLIISVVLVPVPILLSFFMPDMSDAFQPLRAAGTYLNANQASEAVILWLIMLQHRLRGYPLLLFFLVGAIAVVLTFSRSGMMGMALIGGLFLLRGRLPKAALALPVVLVLSYSTVILFAEEYLGEFVKGEGAAEQLVNRLKFFSELGSDSALDDNSSQSRLFLVQTVASAAIQRPFTGHGQEARFVFESASHNILVDLFFTYGLAGIVLYGWLGWLLFDAGRRQGHPWLNAPLIVYVWFTAFNHAHLSALYWLIFYAIALHPERIGTFQPSHPWRRAERRKGRKRRSRRRAIGGRSSASSP